MASSYYQKPAQAATSLVVVSVALRSTANYYTFITRSVFRHGNPGDYVWGPGGLDAIITQLLNSVEGSGPPPADKETIERLPTAKITAEQVGKSPQTEAITSSSSRLLAD